MCIFLSFWNPDNFLIYTNKFLTRFDWISLYTYISRYTFYKKNRLFLNFAQFCLFVKNAQTQIPVNHQRIYKRHIKRDMLVTIAIIKTLKRKSASTIRTCVYVCWFMYILYNLSCPLKLMYTAPYRLSLTNSLSAWIALTTPETSPSYSRLLIIF